MKWMSAGPCLGLLVVGFLVNAGCPKKGGVDRVSDIASQVVLGEHVLVWANTEVEVGGQRVRGALWGDEERSERLGSVFVGTAVQWVDGRLEVETSHYSFWPGDACHPGPTPEHWQIRFLVAAKDLAPVVRHPLGIRYQDGTGVEVRAGVATLNGRVYLDHYHPSVDLPPDVVGFSFASEPEPWQRAWGNDEIDAGTSLWINGQRMHVGRSQFWHESDPPRERFYYCDLRTEGAGIGDGEAVIRIDTGCGRLWAKVAADALIQPDRSMDAMSGLLGMIGGRSEEAWRIPVGAVVFGINGVPLGETVLEMTEAESSWTDHETNEGLRCLTRKWGYYWGDKIGGEPYQVCFERDALENLPPVEHEAGPGLLEVLEGLGEEIVLTPGEMGSSGEPPPMEED